MIGVEEELRHQLRESPNGSGGSIRIPDGRTAAPHVEIVAAARRHPILVLVPVLVMVVGALAIGLRRSPAYTATTHLQVGINLNAPGALTGYSTATAALASAYARAVDAGAVVVPVAKRYHLSPAAVRARISATPVPQSPLLSVTASDQTASGAVALVNGLSQSLLTYINTTSAAGAAATRSLYREYRAVSSTLNAAEIRAADAQQAYIHKRSAANFNALRDARTDVQATQLQATTIQSAYVAAAQNGQATTSTTLLEAAAGASSDRTRKLELLGFIGLLGGLAIGLALASVKANHEARRSAPA